MVFVREDIHFKVISKEALSIEGMFIELNFRKKKWLLSCSYNPNYNTYRSSRNIKEKLRFILCTIRELNFNRGFQYRHKSLLHEDIL